MPFGPALPKGVRTPSTKTTSRSERGRRSSDDTGPPQQFGTGRREARLSTSYPRVTLAASRATPQEWEHLPPRRPLRGRGRSPVSVPCGGGAAAAVVADLDPQHPLTGRCPDVDH